MAHVIVVSLHGGFILKPPTLIGYIFIFPGVRRNCSSSLHSYCDHQPDQTIKKKISYSKLVFGFRFIPSLTRRSSASPNGDLQMKIKQPSTTFYSQRSKNEVFNQTTKTGIDSKVSHIP